MVKGVRGLRFGLCFRNVPILIGPDGGFNVISGKRKWPIMLGFPGKCRCKMISSMTHSLIMNRVGESRLRDFDFMFFASELIVF